MLNNLKPTSGSRKDKVRRCRGEGSGLGKNGGSGHKGQNSRSGGGVKLGFEGGQNPLWRRLPKRGSGFQNKCHKLYAVVSLDKISAKYSDGEVVDVKSLTSKGLIKKELYGVKILNGKLDKKVTFKGVLASESALKAIEKSGSTFEASK